MKKSISILSVFLLASLSACRSENADPPMNDFSKDVVPQYYQRDSTESSHSSGGKDDEPPRKDLQQWKMLP